MISEILPVFEVCLYISSNVYYAEMFHEELVFRDYLFGCIVSYLHFCLYIQCKEKKYDENTSIEDDSVEMQIFLTQTINLLFHAENCRSLFVH